ncbi:MAG TPA: chemotaxis protein [Dissulfurispiraceae bacterium]|nr:chemotaxis protein [Dissulfurispiraceae bacterium]
MAKQGGRAADSVKVGANDLELIVFKMFNVATGGSEETLYYGVNVAKVREIMPMPTLTKVPDMPDYAEAITEVRGEVIPIINLAKWMHINPPQDKAIRAKVIVLSMMNTIVGMIVHDVERIRRISWEQVKQPPSMLQTKYGGKITGVTKIDAEGESLLLILDLEGMMADIGVVSMEAAFQSETLGDDIPSNLSGTVMIADDSAVARRILKDNLENRGLKVIVYSDGKQALEALHRAKAKLGAKPITDYVQLLITDVEMPEMDGIALAHMLKSDEQFRSLPIIVNTSLSGDDSRAKAKSMGADGYLVKFDIVHLIKEVAKFLSH